MTDPHARHTRCGAARNAFAELMTVSSKVQGDHTSALLVRSFSPRVLVVVTTLANRLLYGLPQPSDLYGQRMETLLRRMTYTWLTMGQVAPCLTRQTMTRSRSKLL